jgi:hypothetical protein
LYVDRTEIPVRVAAFPFAVPPEIYHAFRECLTLGLIICKAERGTHRHLFPPEGVILDGDGSLNRKDWNNTIFQTMEAAGPTLEWTEQDTPRRLRAQHMQFVYRKKLGCAKVVIVSLKSSSVDETSILPSGSTIIPQAVPRLPFTNPETLLTLANTMQGISAVYRKRPCEGIVTPSSCCEKISSRARFRAGGSRLCSPVKI